MKGLTRYVIVVLALPVFGNAGEALGSHMAAGAFWSAHRQVFLIEVTNGPARQFNAVVDAEIPVQLVSDQAKVQSLRLVEIDDRGEAIARVGVQVDATKGSGRLWLPLAGQTAPGAKRRFLLFADGPAEVAADQDRAAPPERAFDAVQTEISDGEIRVGNQLYQLGQPTKGGGGLISSVTFAQSGLTTRQFTWDDRIYNDAVPNMASLYTLRSDADSSAAVVHRGPLRTVVEVNAHYARGAEHTKGNARAVYRYEFLAGSPLIAVSAAVTQNIEESWTELHFLQLSTKGTAFGLWRAGDNLAGQFTGTKQSRHVPRWGVMSNGSDAIGLFSRDGLIWYDDPHGYCNYFQFPVPQWKSRERHFSGWIYIGPLQPHAIMEQWFTRLTQPPKVTVHPLPAMQTLRQALAGLPTSPGLTEKKDYERALCLSLLNRDPATFKGADVIDLIRDSALLAAPHAVDALHWESCIGDRADYAALIRQGGDLLWLANRRAVFRFDLARGGRLVQVLDCRGGRDFIGCLPIDKVPLWRLGIRRGDGKTVTTDSAIAGRPKVAPPPIGDARSKNPESLTVALEWPAFAIQDCKGTLAVRVEMKIVPDCPTITARLSVDNQLTDAGLWSVEFPVISPLGQAGRLDAAIPRLNWGKLHQNTTGEHRGEYPSGWWPMQYLSVTDGPSTLYLGAHDPQCGLKHFGLKAGGEFHFDLDPPDMGKPRANFAMDYDIVFGPLAGDWFDAARFYRDWALKQVWMSRGPLDKRDDMPRKLRDGLVWLLLSGEPKLVLQTAIAAQEFLGVPMGIHWYNWHQIPFDTDYPHYFPTKPGFKEAVKTLTDRGIYVMPYINGRLWDSGLDDFKTVALPAATKGINGKYYIEEYGSGRKLVPMCPTTKLWQDKVCQIIDTLVNEEGVNAVYLDQIASAGPRQCFDASHGHPLGGGTWWASSYWTMMDRIQQIGAARGPDVFFTTENNAESYSHNIDAFLIWNPRRPEMVPINAVVYGGMRVHFANRVHPNDSDMAFAMKVGRDWLWGTQLGWMDPFYMAPEHRTKGEYFRRLAKARMTANKFLSYGQMLRPPEIDCDAEVSAEWYGESKIENTVTWPAIGGACWRAPDGHVGLIFTNYDTSPHEFSFKPSEEAVKLMGSSALLCERTETGLVKARVATTQDGVMKIASMPARGTLILESIPCASAAERDEKLKALPPGPVGETEAVAAKPMLQVRLELPRTPAPAGQPIPGGLVLIGPRPSESGWSVQLKAPQGYAVEPAESIVIPPSAVGKQKIDLLIHPPVGATGDQPIQVELTRRLTSGTLRIAAPTNQK
jgi:hypothetical protein